MAWILLIIAGLFEIGWPLGFKLASMHSKYFIWFIGLSILSMGLSGYISPRKASRSVRLM